MGDGVALGLGCSRFGSLVQGTDRAQAIALVREALRIGVSHFDTATIYGQGDSERFLGEALAGSDARITTKAGQVFPLSKRLLLPLKGALKPVLAKAGAASAAVSAARVRELPRDWSARYLTHALEGSLRRLRREQVDTFLLHSPSADALAREEPMAALVRLKQAGKAAEIGASIDDATAFAAALRDPRIEVIQYPSSPALPMPAQHLDDARRRGIRLVVREILGGARSAAEVDAALAFAASQPVDLVLLGTRSAAHLAHARQALSRC